VQALRRYWLYGPVDAAAPIERLGSNAVGVTAPAEATQTTSPAAPLCGEAATRSNGTLAPPAAEQTPQQILAGGRAWWQE
jgi:hypothetical protein